MTLRVGIIGCGKIAPNHVRAFQSMDGVALVGCVDADQARAEKFARDNGLPRAFESFADLVMSGVDAISVCTPHPVHEQNVLQAAAAGVHVLCEKPIAVDTPTADRMIAAANEAGIVLSVVFQRRLWPAAQRIKQAIEDGTVGTPRLAEVSVILRRESDYYAQDPWRGKWDTDGGGVLMTQAVHQIDMLQWFLGTPVSVTGHIRTHFHKNHMETEDTASAVVEFESGATASITATTGAVHNLGNRIQLVGETGAVVSLTEFPEGAEGFNDLWLVPEQREVVPPFRADVEPLQELADINARLSHFHTLQIQDFAESILQGRPPAVTGEEARVSLRVIEAIYESSRTRETVFLDEKKRSN
ncbi:Gfo/Idh/MocA family protein [Micrococcoides hystricis]|uniref:Gfo/Idh/MocA family protein n=1 Tax=Micrococcoides hystricis TaxID=1572761 RepID=A0ABV6PDS9_9MICC